MTETCKECGKELGWFARHGMAKGFCIKCASEKMKHCRICGKKINKWSLESDFVAMHDFVCQDCWSKGKEHLGERSCGNCAYCATKVFAEEKPFLISYQFTKEYVCTKFGFDVTNRLHFAGKCTSHLTREQYEQKCLRGELDSDMVTCPYCQVKYDRVKQASCPNCGAYPRGR